MLYIFEVVIKYCQFLTLQRLFFLIFEGLIWIWITLKVQEYPTKVKYQ